jgi:abequosyltransferase
MRLMPSQDFLISFAIPTYNFGAFIGDTIRSIFLGKSLIRNEQIEVVVVDGASLDNTSSVIADLAKQFPTIRWVPMEQRGGIDYDLDHAISLCTAPYVWMLSADDLLESGWDEVIFKHINQTRSPDIILVPAIVCTLAMIPMRRNRILDLSLSCGSKSYLMSDKVQRHLYFQQALTLEALFSYMSAVVVRRETWMALPPRVDYFKSCWAHCARLMPLLSLSYPNAKITYLNSYLLKKRSGNDSFMEHGLIRRIGLTVNGWDRILKEFYSGSMYFEQAWRLLQRDASVILFMYAKLGAATKHDRQELISLARITYLSNSVHISGRAKFFLISIMPSLPWLIKFMAKFLPTLILIRHRIKGIVH